MQEDRVHPLALACVAALGLILAGCPRSQAVYTPNGRGGYTLRATTESLDDAMKRFERTAAKLCPDGSYALGEPDVLQGTSRPITVAIELTCTGP